MNINQIAEQFGISVDSLTSFTNWVKAQCEKNPSLLDLLQESPHRFMEEAMKAWLKQTKEYYAKLLDHNSPERKQLSEQVYNELRNRK